MIPIPLVLKASQIVLLCALIALIAAPRPLQAQEDAAVLNRGATKEEAERATQERAISRGLAWLAANQRKDGGWSSDDRPATNAGQMVSNAQATGLAMLAFMGAGQTLEEGRYRANLEKAVWFLASQVADTDDGADLRGDQGNLRSHAIATLALCELYTMGNRKNDDLKNIASAALDQSIAWQNVDTGGWGAEPGEASDLRVTTWQIMAQRSGEFARLKSPTKRSPGALSYIKSLQIDNQPFFASATLGKDPIATAMGALSRVHLGADLRDREWRFVAAYLQDQREAPWDPESLYIATELIFHVQRSPSDWRDWERPLAAKLVASQCVEGSESGSWLSDGAQYDRLSATAFNLMSLEVYYRFRPLVSSSKNVELSERRVKPKGEDQK